MDESQHHWIKPLLREHPALLVTGVYIIASTIGMLYSWDYLRMFGINVFNYAQIGDFLLASLKEPYTWLIVIVSVLLVLADNAMSRRAARRDRPRFLRWYASPGYRKVNFIAAIMLVVVFTHVFAVRMKAQVFAGKGRLVQVQLTDFRSNAQFALLGTTGQFIFLFEPTSERVYIHPHENVYAISFGAKRER